jgi:hypothetical protein
VVEIESFLQRLGFFAGKFYEQFFNIPGRNITGYEMDWQISDIPLPLHPCEREYMTMYREK